MRQTPVIIPRNLKKQENVMRPWQHPQRIIMTTTTGITTAIKKLRSLVVQPNRMKQGKSKKEVHILSHMFDMRFCKSWKSAIDWSLISFKAKFTADPVSSMIYLACDSKLDMAEFTPFYVFLIRVLTDCSNLFKALLTADVVASTALEAAPVTELVAPVVVPEIVLAISLKMALLLIVNRRRRRKIALCIALVYCQTVYIIDAKLGGIYRMVASSGHVKWVQKIIGKVGIDCRRGGYVQDDIIVEGLVLHKQGRLFVD